MYDREKYKAKDPVWTVYESRPVGNPTALCVEPGSFKWNTKLTGTYTGGLYTYTNKQKKININVKVGTDERQLKLTGKVSSEADAKARLIAAIRMPTTEQPRSVLRCWAIRPALQRSALT